MPRRGWSTLERPAGWLQVIRGPRPPAVQWPKASRGQGHGQKPPLLSKKENKKQTEPKVSGLGEPPRPTTSLSRRSRPSIAFADGSERIWGRQQSRGQDVRCSEGGTAGGYHGPSRRPTRRMRSIRGESQEQTFEGRRSSSQSSGRTLQVGTRVEGGRTEVGGASSRGFAPPAAPASGDEVSNLKKLVTELRGQVAVLEENKHDNWEVSRKLRRLRLEVEDLRRSRNEAKTSEFSTELAIPGSMNPSARMASLIDVSIPRFVDGVGRQIPVVSIRAAWHPGGRSVKPWPEQQRVWEVYLTELWFVRMSHSWTLQRQRASLKRSTSI